MTKGAIALIVETALPAAGKAGVLKSLETNLLGEPGNGPIVAAVTDETV